MPPHVGEERVQTVFADIHCYFVAPTPKPLHHRFDKGSYFYVYYNATRQSARLEIANNPGTPEQDAFNGSLDGVYVRYSYKFPTLLTLVVDGADATPNSPFPSPIKDPQEWRLASADPRDQGRFKYRLHTLDIYFWTQEDAKGVVQTVKRVLRPRQLDILDAPRRSTNASADMSPVVQQLENVAVTDPAYRNGQTRNSQNNAATLLPPPPPSFSNSRQSPVSQAGSAVRSASVKSNEMPTSFAPMAYNPAAPAAPEPIAHREKTPPPADAADGTGLAAAAYADHTQAYASTHPQAHAGVLGQPQPLPGYHGSPPPPQRAPGHYGSPPPQAAYPSPPTAQTFQSTPSVSSNFSSQRTSTTSSFAFPPSSATSPRARQSSSSQPGYAPPPQDPNAHLYGAPAVAAAATQSGRPGASSPPGFAPPPSPGQDPNAHLYSSQTQSQPQSLPLESPGTQIYGSAPFAPQPHQPLSHLQPQYPDYLQSRPPPQPQPPPGGFAQYPYARQPQHHHQHHHDGSDASRYDVHNQVYRPTEEEDRHKHGKSSAGQSAGSGGGGKPAGRLEETAGKVDKKVGGFLRKLEKRL